MSKTAYGSSIKGPKKDMLPTRTSYWAGVIHRAGGCLQNHLDLLTNLALREERVS